jgi:predicted phosphoribosyltransferase
MFQNRTDAGRQLGVALSQYHATHSIVLAIPRGGVEVAHQVAKSLKLSLSLVVVRKLPFPDNPEAGFGALAEDGSLYFLPGANQRLPQSVILNTVQEQQTEVARRVKVLRGGDPLPELRQRHVILVDDGIAMGSTTQAAVKCCRGLGARRVTVAAPVASPEARTSLEASADEVVVLLCPPFFRAVAEFYRDWYDVPDQEVIGIMADARQSGLLAEEKGNHDEGPGHR